MTRVRVAITPGTKNQRPLKSGLNQGRCYIFGLAGNAVLDALVAETADNLRFHHAMSRKANLRTFASFMYQATSWKRPRKVVARLECSLQSVVGETGMRQEVDIRYVVTSLEGSAQHLYENVLYEETSVKRYSIAKPLLSFLAASLKTSISVHSAVAKRSSASPCIR
jgi:GTP cyclohydrolase FolE2